MQTKQNTVIRKKQSLVHKVLSGVAILSYVCCVAGENIHPRILSHYLMWKMWGDKEFLSFIGEKNGMRVVI
jgi:hypothetical protein